MAAGAGDDRQVFPAHRRQAKDLQVVAQGGGIMDPDDAALAESGIHHPVVAGKGGGVGRSDGFAELADVGLEGHDGLGGSPGHLHELAPVLDPLQVEEDIFGPRVFDEIFEKLFGLDIQHVPGGDEFIQAQPLVAHEVEDGHAHAPALGDHGDVSRSGRFASRAERGCRGRFPC